MVSMGASAGGGLLKGFGALFGGDAKSEQYKYQAAVAQANAKIAQQNSDYALFSGGHAARQQGMKDRFKIGQTRVLQSGRGIDINTGSAADVRESQRQLSYEDQSTIRDTAARKAYGHRVEGAMKTAEGKMLESAAKQSKVAGYIDAAGSLLGSATSVASKWTEASQLGIFGGSEPAYADTRTSDDYYYG
jgi:hypothetical protein